MSRSNPFRYFKTSLEIIRLAVMLYIRFPLSLRNVEDLLWAAPTDWSRLIVSASPDCSAPQRWTARRRSLSVVE
jgi:transposase-like protein